MSSFRKMFPNGCIRSHQVDNTWLSVLLKVCVAVFMFGAASAAYASSDQVKEIVQENVSSLLAKYEEEKVYFESDPERFLTAMEAELGKIVDFKRIAARVMGKYAKRATKDERGRFTSVFKDSLFDTYTKSLVSAGSFDIDVVKATINPRSDKRASVDMNVTSDSGNVYPMTYSMYKNKQGEWYMENVIVFGINVGLAFRDKFEAEYRKRKGDISAVIDNWSVDLDVQLPEGVELPQNAELPKEVSAR